MQYFLTLIEIERVVFILLPLQGLFFALFFCLSLAWLNNLHILLAGRQIQILKNIHGFIHGIIGYVISITHLKQFIMKYASYLIWLKPYYKSLCSNKYSTPENDTILESETPSRTENKTFCLQTEFFFQELVQVICQM